ncbi:putative Zn-dependent protease [Paramagnetospirillum caucaseum]|uniref:Putative Zn-dependent protease n=1 Tax=Paramagnetospirillum caucaseum TaxID=1244869 RepID=M2ZBX7_9PROT|nr:M48 family metalloprotease [Paramagnetospirillum caucaseum]EME71945.1 putative Zn-dependent protease [Paramagnetospirillum caucaseum]
MLTRIILLVTFLLVASMPPALAQSQPRRQFIRDAEVENTIRTFGTPIFQAAGLDPSAVRINLIIDSTLNAFVAGGQNIFFHTGLLVRSEHPGQLIGVMAHETGHIAGGHLIRSTDAMASASTEAILATLLAAAAGAASGRGDAAAAMMLGGNELAMRSLLAFSRSQESQADQMAMRFLDDTRQSGKGLIEFFEILGDQEALVSSRQDPYVRTHPLTRDRVSFVRNAVEHSPYSKTPWPPEWVEMHKRMKAKLFAFIEPPIRTFQRYKETDASIEARYARAVAAYRKPDVAMALGLIDGLIKERPNDPYFWELKGQMLFENARGTEAVEPYRKAVKLLPDSALLRIALGQVLIETEDPAMLGEAETHLTAAVNREPEDRFAWQQLAIAFGRNGKEGMASYALAEHYMLSGKLSEAQFHANKAEQLLGKQGSVWLRIQDIKERASHVRAEQERGRKWW